jgi:hypothetical protein
MFIILVFSCFECVTIVPNYLYYMQQIKIIIDRSEIIIIIYSLYRIHYSQEGSSLVLIMLVLF